MTLKSYEGLRMAFTSDVSMYDLEMSVFIDDTGADRRIILRKHGMAIMRGENQLKATNFYAKVSTYLSWL